MTNQVCDMCWEAPATVFRPDAALCRQCRRDVKRLEQEDNAIPNVPFCGVCGGACDRNGECGWCEAQAVRAANERMVHVG